MKRRIVLLGPPASGKGTQAKMLARKFDLPTVSTGALLREEAERGTPLGEQVLAYTKEGLFFPDEIAGAVLRNWMHAHGSSGWVLDGFPRTLPQARQLDAEFGGPDVVASLEVDAVEVHRRLADRLNCPQCAATFSVRLDGVCERGGCPHCGGILRRREDDEASAIEERLRQHAERTVPVLEHYTQRGLLIRVDAAGPREAVFANLCRQLDAEVCA